MADRSSKRSPGQALLPYLLLARVQAPIGTWLLMWPCWWAVALARPGFDDGLRLIALFLAGAFALRAAGCIYNDIVDRDFDARVARTRERPLASGRVSLTRALLFMAALLGVGLIVLIQLNPLAIAIGLGSVPLILAYPFMKRITWWPQAWLGLTFNWGALVGWAAADGSLAPPALVLYGAGIAWTLGYDTIYAHQDKDDDALIGVKSSALWLGRNTRPWLYRFYALAMAGLIGAAVLAGAAWPTYVVLLTAAIQLAWQARTVDLDDPASCLDRFKSNHGFSALVFAAYLLA
ncbi:MAG: 4-hydroxybenzoate octaprenyltransferase [Alphaproteobacteria bacterium]|jgi:4-hydroxybenzoate polyprenyltransferase|nr:4-hydroxybenzoate octaprenyltransferase [Alphaproteobacteria bacterium]MDP6517022.1 4-hydroxybenzoate octaprenyltransferase [Alphaproteobacteria bacterium]